MHVERKSLRRGKPDFFFFFLKASLGFLSLFNFPFLIFFIFFLSFCFVFPFVPATSGLRLPGTLRSAGGVCPPKSRPLLHRAGPAPVPGLPGPSSPSREQPLRRPFRAGPAGGAAAAARPRRSPPPAAAGGAQGRRGPGATAQRRGQGAGRAGHPRSGGGGVRGDCAEGEGGKRNCLSPSQPSAPPLWPSLPRPAGQRCGSPRERGCAEGPLGKVVGGQRAVMGNRNRGSPVSLRPDALRSEEK